MPKLIFINLGIDQFWDEDKILDRIFPVRNPFFSVMMNAYQDLGIYLAGPGDCLISRNGWDAGYRDFLDLHRIRCPELLRIPFSPFDAEWLDDLRSRIADLGRGGWDDLLVAGTSSLELRLGELLQLRRDPAAAGFAGLQGRLNQKVALVEVARRAGIRLPKSERVRLGELRSATGRFGFPCLLKARYGSGGGGVIQLRSSDDPILRHIGRVLELKKLDPEWLLQEELERSADYCCVGEVFRDREPAVRHVFQVSYGKARSSKRHRTPGNGPEVSEIREAFLKVARELKRQGYDGPLGTDSFVTRDGRVFPIVDLNARLDKSRLIYEAARAFKIPPERIDSHAVSFDLVPEGGFSAWWARLRSVLGLSEKGETEGGRLVYPYLVSSAFGVSPVDAGKKRRVEIYFFVGQEEPPGTPRAEEWRGEVERAIVGTARQEEI